MNATESELRQRVRTLLKESGLFRSTNFDHRTTANSIDSPMLLESDGFALFFEVSDLLENEINGSAVRGRIFRSMKQFESIVSERYGIFVAPVISSNIAESLRQGIWYEEDKAISVRILPITVEQFAKLLKIGRNENSLLELTILRCLRYTFFDGPTWKIYIEQIIDRAHKESLFSNSKNSY
jgi:hypothetical protein